MDERVRNLLKDASLNDGAVEEDIQRLLAYAGTDLPQAYLDLLKLSDGVEGPIGERGYLQLWPAADVPVRNDGCCTADFAPGLLLIGSDGGGTALGIDTVSQDPQTMDYV